MTRINSTLFLSLSFLLLAYAGEADEFQEQCQQISQYLVKDQYLLQCHGNYHHYNADAYRQYYQKNNAQTQGIVKIASFNLLQPGSSASFYKDYKLLAELMNKWDLISAVELIAVVGEDLKHNQAVLSFINDGPQLIAQLQKKIQESCSLQEKSKLEEELITLQKDLKLAPNLYRAPGYLQILNELRQLDPSWSLLLTPRGEGTEEANLKELAGFYYRAQTVRPLINPYCREVHTHGTAHPFACIPDFSAHFMDTDYRQVFSRRPFMASFESGDFTVALLAFHSIFSSPTDDELMRNILTPTFGVADYTQLGVGVTKQNYARFAELKVIMEFIRRMQQRFEQKDIILIGDFNLEISNPFLPESLRPWPNSELFIADPTTISQRRYQNDGSETFGYASNYDHFVLDPTQSRECVDERGILDAKRYDIFREDISTPIEQKYLIRTENYANGKYIIDQAGINKMNAGMKLYEQALRKRQTVRDNKIVWDDYKFSYRLSSMKKRVYTDQQYDNTYYRLYAELLSDHAPILLSCRTTASN